MSSHMLNSSSRYEVEELPRDCDLEIHDSLDHESQPELLPPEYESASGRLLARNTIWNLAGYATPLLIAVAVIPYLIRDLGTAKYGVLTLAWGIVGYFGVFEMGLSDALTKLVAERVGDGSSKEINALFHTGFLLLLGSSIAGAVLLAFAAKPLTYTWLHIVPELRHETLYVFRIFALALPFVLGAACFRGLLAAYQRFDLINKVQIASGILTFAGPALVLPFSHSLIPIVAVLGLSRVFAWLAYMFFCTRAIPSFSLLPRYHKRCVRPLMTFGGWISVSNITDPLFLYSDRFLLGVMVSLNAVAFYATPFDMVVRLWMIPDALNTAFFPAYATSLRGDGRHAIRLLEPAGNYLFPVIVAPVLLIVLFSRNILTIWVGADFAAHSAVVLAWLAIGVFFSSIARLPWTLLIASRPDLPAKLVFVEAPLYVTVLYILIRLFGLEGAAIAWMLRNAFNCIVLHGITWRVLPRSHKAISKNAMVVALIALIFGVAGLLPDLLSTKAIFFIVSYSGLLIWLWFYILSPEERKAMIPAVYSA